MIILFPQKKMIILIITCVQRAKSSYIVISMGLPISKYNWEKKKLQSELGIMIDEASL
jgi:hypothetical protein